MRRGVTLARVIVIALALTHAVGLAEAARRATCEEACHDDDGCEDDCGPGEASSCRCHGPSAAQLIGAPVAQVSNADAPVARVAARDAGDRMHGSPDPLEILHVPRPGRA